MSNTENLLELRNICFSVDQQIIIDNLSLTLQPNEFKVITGPSGCGKSTLLKIIASLFPPPRAIFSPWEEYYYDQT